MLKRIVWFQAPGTRRTPDLSRWQRWCEAAQGDDAGARIRQSVRKALHRELWMALVAIAINAVCGFGAALTLKSLIEHLVDGGTPLVENLTLGITCMVLTYVSWLALNHTFLLAELTGIGARTYIEQRLLRSAAGSDRPLELVTLMDREAARVEAAWTGLVFIVLSLATVAFTSAFFFVALGLSTLSALSVIALGSLVIFWISKRLNSAHAELTVTSAERMEVGMFSINNRLLGWLKNWNGELTRRYLDKRQGEERSLQKAARLVSVISLVSTLTPIAAIVAAAFTQFAVRGNVDAAGLLSAMALIGGLRSVANNVPEIVQSVTQGAVGHDNVARYLLSGRPSNRTAVLPQSDARHIAVVGAAGSGKTSILKTGAQSNSCFESKTLFVPDEPWIFPGGLYENLGLYRSDYSDSEARQALALSRLPETFYADYLESKAADRTDGWNVSRGQGKRLELARAILAEPACVFMDQPTSGLDGALANGLLRSLLQGQWRETKVVYATDKPDEIDAAQEVWTVADGEVVHVRRNAPTRTYPTEIVAVPEEHSVFPRPPGITNLQESAKSTRRSLIDFGIARIALMACVLFASRDVLTIVGDYTVAGGMSSANARTSSVVLLCVLAAGALLSVSGALLTVQSSIRAASRQCGKYFSSVIGRPDRTQTVQGDDDHQSKLTWDQRRVDEALPSMLLQALAAVTLLITTTGFVLSKNPFTLPLVAGMCVVYWRSSRRSGDLLREVNEREIVATSTVLARIEAITWSSGRLQLASDNSNLVGWLNKSLMSRALASIDNSRARRWFTYKLDLIGVSFLSVVVGSTVFVHAHGGLGLAHVLALSLSYSLIALFSRVGTRFVELRQILDSADRLLTSAVGEAPSPTRSMSQHEALVSVTDVSFVAARTGMLLFESGSASFRRQEVVLITGPSGVGKSTFAKLLVGSLRPTTGVLSTLGRTAGYVTESHDQEVLLLTSNPVFMPGRLAEHFDNPDPTELARAVQHLNVADVVERLPFGFDEVVPSTGQLNLSKTELQRLALIDVLINRPAIAILDEATSELSADDELALLRTLTSALPETLFFIITHNLELAKLASRVFGFTHEKKLIEFSGKEHVDGMATPARCVL